MTKQTQLGALEVRFGGKTVGLYSVPEGQEPMAKNRMLQLPRSGGADKNVQFVRTLAAAPDLLDALIGLCREINHPEGFDPIHPKCQQVRAAAMAAIAKARGD